jgi:hypothetical protein
LTASASANRLEEAVSSARRAAREAPSFLGDRFGDIRCPFPDYRTGRGRRRSAAVSKIARRRQAPRGFKSLPLRSTKRCATQRRTAPGVAAVSETASSRPWKSALVRTKSSDLSARWRTTGERTRLESARCDPFGGGRASGPHTPNDVENDIEFRNPRIRPQGGAVASGAMTGAWQMHSGIRRGIIAATATDER